MMDLDQVRECIAKGLSEDNTVWGQNEAGAVFDRFDGAPCYTKEAAATPNPVQAPSGPAPM